MISRRWMRRRTLAIGLACGVSALGPVLGASASTRTSAGRAQDSLSPLQQGLRFYRGKTITLISPDAPGGGYDLTARAVAPYLASYLGATVNVENIAAGDTVAGQDTMAAAPPNGLTVGMVDPTVDVLAEITNTPGINFNPERVAYLGGTGPSPVAYTCLTSSPYGSLADVVRMSQTSPVQEVVSQAGAQYVEMQLINAAFGIQAREITGYVNTAAEIQGFERGDGQCSVLGLTNISGFIGANHARILLLTSPYSAATPDYSASTGALLWSKALTEFKPTDRLQRLSRTALVNFVDKNSGHEFNTQAHVPHDEIVALSTAIEGALKDPTVEHNLVAVGGAPGWIPGTRYRTGYSALVSSLKPLKTLVGGTG